jgi:hypothetical protein
VLNFIELHYDTGDAIIINVNKIVSYARVPGRNYTDLLIGRESLMVRESPTEIPQLIIASQGATP